MREFTVLRLGIVEHEAVATEMVRLQQARLAEEIPDTLILVEHPEIVTVGPKARKDGVVVPESYATAPVDRGGGLTCHGPGQLVGYPILDLHNYKKSISWYMRSLEQVIIDTLDIWGLKALRKEGLTGVWVGDEKIAALGVRISRWVTMHGFALNVNTDLQYYDGIIPCGILEYGVTSMENLLKNKINMDDVKQHLVSCFQNKFN